MTQPSTSVYVPALRFRWLTPYYDRIVALTVRERTVKHALIAQANLRPGDHVLDLACGTGTLAIWMAQAQPRAVLVGVDGDPAILAIAARKARDAGVAITLDCARSEQLPYATACFDQAVSSLFFHHLSWPNKQRATKELFRVLKPGAQLNIADWGPSTNPLMRALFVFVQLLDGFGNTRDNVNGRLVPLMQDAGFVAVEQTMTFATVFGTLALYRAKKPPDHNQDRP